MMSEKKLSVLAGALVVLVAGAVLLWFHGKPVTPSTNPLGTSDAAKIVSIVIETQTSTMTFEQKEGKWLMTKPVEDQVDPTAIDRLVTVMKAFTVGSVVSENPDNYARFGLEPEKAARIRVFLAGREKAALDGYVGKSAADPMDSFFRLEGKRPVYVAAGLPSYLFKAEPRQYRFAKVFPANIDEVDSIVIKEDKKTWTMTRSSDTWTLANLKIPVTSFEIRTLAQKLADWRAVDFGGAVETAWPFGPDGIMSEITIMRGPVPTVMRIGKQSMPDPSEKRRGEMRPVTVDGRQYVLAVPTAMIDEFFTQLKSFK